MKDNKIKLGLLSDEFGISLLENNSIMPSCVEKKDLIPSQEKQSNYHSLPTGKYCFKYYL
jgi:hypothetical protein